MTTNQLSFTEKLQLIVNGIKKLFTVNKNLFWFLILISIISFSYGVSQKNNYRSLEDTTGATNAEVHANITVNSASILIIFMLFILLYLALVILFQGMIAYASFKASKNKSVSIKEAFDATKNKFWILVGVSIIIFLKIIGGLILFIIPGIRAICRYWIIYFVIFDKNLSARESVAYTKKITKHNLTVPFISIITQSILSPINNLIQYGAMVGYYPKIAKSKGGSKKTK